MEITELEHNKTYKYFGINEMNGINHAIDKEKIRKDFYKRTERYAKNQVIAINTLAIPVVIYSFN